MALQLSARQQQTIYRELREQLLHLCDDVRHQFDAVDITSAATQSGDSPLQTAMAPLALLQHCINEMQAHQQALERLSKGEYGICKNCGERIELSILTAAPATEYCLACQDPH